ncbi:MAG: HAMP domain-containing protein [Acidobacteria bacterium]|nr:HAMP domain-containing protein [Acidobacteriota bacterium]
MNWARLHIRWKLFLMFVAVICAAVLTADFYLGASLRRQFLRQIEQQLRNETLLVKRYVESQPSGVPGGWQDQAADLLGEELSVRVTLIDHTGRVLGDSDLSGPALRDVENHRSRPEVLDAFRTGFGISRRWSTTVRSELLYCAMTYRRQDGSGVVRLAMPLREIQAAVRQMRLQLLWASATALGVALLLSFAFSRRLSRKLVRMSEVAADMARGSFDRRIQVQGADELDALGASLNRMAVGLETSFRQIQSDKDQLEAILAGMAEGVMVADAVGRILLMNPAMQRILGLSHFEPGRGPLEIIRIPAIQEAFRTVLSTCRPHVQEISLEPIRKTLLVGHFAPLSSEDPGGGAVAVFHDITELRRLEQVRKDFVSNISHELRTPLTSIKGYAETLREGDLVLTEQAREFLRIIEANVERLNRLVGDLLELSRLESQRVEFRWESVSLRETVDQLLNSFQKQISDKELAVRNEIPAELAPARADLHYLEQVFINLIDNAIKYTPGKGEIRIGGREADGLLEVEISDTGPGIPDGDLPRVFERFYRVDKGRSREMGGTGLGLSIVKHVVQAHGGRVWVRNRPQRGSTFGFSLPRA